jgi:nucleoside-diphosphate-sugar epimerase
VDELPVAEDHPGHPHSPYGASKRGVEEYLHTYEALYGLRWTSLALGNVYGPRQDPGGEAGVVSIFGGRMLEGGTSRSTATASRPATSSSSPTSSTRSSRRWTPATGSG